MKDVSYRFQISSVLLVSRKKKYVGQIGSRRKGYMYFEMYILGRRFKIYIKREK